MNMQLSTRRENPEKIPANEQHAIVMNSMAKSTANKKHTVAVNRMARSGDKLKGTHSMNFHYIHTSEFTCRF